MSRLAEPRGHAGDVLAGFVQLRNPLEALLEQVLDVAELRRNPLLREVEDDLLGAVDEVGCLAGTVPPELRDLAARPDQPAQRGELVDDPRVVRGIRGRRHERRELLDARPASHLFQLAPLLERVDQRDRVHRLALRVELEGGAVDLRVALAVEVAPRRGSRSPRRSRRARASSRRGRTPRHRDFAAERERRPKTGASWATRLT